MVERVYFAKAGTAVKIGVSADVEARIKSLRTANHEPIVLLGSVPGGRAVERNIHMRLADYRIHREWFHDCPELQALFSQLMRFGPAVLGTIKSKRARPSTARASPIFGRIMDIVRKNFPERTAASVATRFGRSQRTAERWLSGSLTPDGEAVLDMFLSPEVGPEFFETETGRFAPARRERFWANIREAIARAEVRLGKKLIDDDEPVDLQTGKG